MGEPGGLRAGRWGWPVGVAGVGVLGRRGTSFSSRGAGRVGRRVRGRQPAVKGPRGWPARRLLQARSARGGHPGGRSSYLGGVFQQSRAENWAVVGGRGGAEGSVRRGPPSMALEQDGGGAAECRSDVWVDEGSWDPGVHSHLSGTAAHQSWSPVRVLGCQMRKRGWAESACLSAEPGMGNGAECDGGMGSRAE